MWSSSSQAEEDLEDEFVDDPINLFFDEDRDSDCKIVDAGIIDLESELEDSDIDIFDISQNNNSSVFERSSNSSILSYTPIIKDVKVKIVDYNRYPWYFRKYFNNVRIPHSHISVGNKTDNELISVQKKSVVAMHTCKIISTKQIEEIDNSHLSALPDLTLKIKYDVDKKGWAIEKRLKTLQQREDIEIQKAVSKRNLSHIDFKRNKGLIGLTVIPKIIVDENTVVSVQKGKVQNKLNALQIHRNGKQNYMSGIKHNVKHSNKTSTNAISVIANTSKDNVISTSMITETCKQNKIAVESPPDTNNKLHLNEQLGKCSLNIAPEIMLKTLKLVKETTDQSNIDAKIESQNLKGKDCNKRAVELKFVKNGNNQSKIVHIDSPIYNKYLQSRLSSKNSLCRRNKTSPNGKLQNKKQMSDKLLSRTEKFVKAGGNVVNGRHSMNSQINSGKRNLVNKTFVCNIKSADRSQKQEKNVPSQAEPQCNVTVGNKIGHIVDIESNMTIRDTRKMVNAHNINTNSLLIKPRIAPIRSTYMQHPSNINFQKTLTPQSLSKDRISGNATSSAVNNTKSKDTFKNICGIGDDVLSGNPPSSVINHNSPMLPSISILRRNSTSQKKSTTPKFCPKQNASIHYNTPSTYTRTTGGNKQLISTVVHKPNSIIHPLRNQGTTNLKEIEFLPPASLELHPSKSIKADVHKRKSDVPIHNQFPRYPAAIVLRPQNNYLGKIVSRSGRPMSYQLQDPLTTCNTQPKVNPQMHGNVNTQLMHQLPLQNISHPNQNIYYPHNFAQHASDYKVGYLQNLVLDPNMAPPGICDVNPNVNWPCGYAVAPPPPPPPLPQPIPPSPHLIQSQFNPNLNSNIPQSNEASIIGINNGGVINKINIKVVPAASNIHLDYATDNKESIVKLENGDENVALGNTDASDMAVDDIENSTPVATKKQMLEEFDKVVQMDGDYITSDLNRQYDLNNDKSNEITANKSTVIKAGPLSKKVKLNQTQISTIGPGKDYVDKQAHLTKGYSPPILPIPTYENILSHLPEPPEYIYKRKDDSFKKFYTKIELDKMKENDCNKEKAKKITLDEYKKRVIGKSDGIHTPADGNNGMKIVGTVARKAKNMADANGVKMEQDLGYDSDTTMKL